MLNIKLCLLKVTSKVRRSRAGYVYVEKQKWRGLTSKGGGLFWERQKVHLKHIFDPCQNISIRVPFMETVDVFLNFGRGHLDWLMTDEGARSCEPLNMSENPIKSVSGH